ncbi:type II toxin-antitoxin system RelE/ParE family toxin [Methylomagnum sp.]
MKTKPLTVVETPTYLRQVAGIWSDEERAAFLDFIARNPDAGDAIPETGGVRKVRWGRAGSGKRGGVRVIYFFFHSNAPLYLLMAYAKSRSENLSPEEKRLARDITAALKHTHRSG